MKVREDVLEDLQWLDENGTGANDAAARTDFPNAQALEKWLERNGHYELWKRFKSRDPSGVHDNANRRVANGVEQIDPIAATISKAQRSTSARIRNKADKVSGLIAELREGLTAEAESEREKSKARADVTRLERELAEAKARLRGKPAVITTTASVDGEHACECGRSFPRRNGLTIHRKSCETALAS